MSLLTSAATFRKMAECRGLAPLARRHALVSTEARLARPVDIPFNRPRPRPRARNRITVFEDEDENDDEDQCEIGPRGRTCTCNLSVLSGTPLLIGLNAVGASGQSCTDTVRGLSPPPLRWATGAFGKRGSRMENGRQPTLLCGPFHPPFSIFYSRRLKMVSREGFPPPTSPF